MEAEASEKEQLAKAAEAALEKKRSELADQEAKMKEVGNRVDKSVSDLGNVGEAEL